MAVRFIVGRAGTGKTHRCLEQVRGELRRSAEGPPLILLVPEQATFQIERELIQTPDLAGYSRARVLSFRRFAHLLFNETGGPAYPPISGLARQMALRAVLAPMRQRLTTFGPSLDRPGFVARLAEAFSEFHRYRVTSEQLRQRAAGERQERLKRKLAELADAFDAFNKYLGEARFTDPDSALTAAAERVGRSRLARGSRVWVDGFAGFTPQELAFLGELAVAAETVEIALVMDPDEVAGLAGSQARDSVPGRLFRRTEQTYLRLARLFAEKGVRVERPVALGRVHRFRSGGRLARLERELFGEFGVGAAERLAPKAKSEIEHPESDASLLARRDDEIVLVEAPDRRAEVRAAANHIRDLVQRFGYRYRQVAVILRSLDEYWPFVVEGFAEAGIPYFMDRREPVSHHPLVELVRSAVRTVSGGLARQDVVGFLKTGLCGEGSDPAFRDAVDRVENYALAYGVAGRAWFEAGSWRFHEQTLIGEEDLAGPGGPMMAEELARAAELVGLRLAPLAEFHRELSACGRDEPTGRQWATALWRLLDSLDVRRTLASWLPRQAGGAGGRWPGMGRDVHSQVLAAVEGLLGDLVVALGGRGMNPSEFAGVLEAGLAELSLGLVPPGLDQVLVGAIERSRHPQIKAALVLGMAERSFPRVAAVQSVLTDEDRQQLAGKDVTGDSPAKAGGASGPPLIELAPGRGELLFDEDLMAYLALTRPSERLWVSYASADDDGRPVNPSRYVHRLRGLFGDLPVVRLAEQPPALASVTAGELAGVLADGFARSEGQGGPGALDARLYELLRASAPESLRRVMSSLAYGNRPGLTPDVARRLFAAGGRLVASVTRLESFAACPFQHLARFGLKLEVRREVEPGPLELGRFYHELLRQLFERLGGGEARAVDWSARPAAELRELVAELVTAARERVSLPVLSGGAAGYALAQAEAVLGDLAEAMRAAGEASPRVRQAAAELVFGTGRDALLPPLEFPLAGGGRLVLRGKMDRLDLADDGSAFVIDYKTSGGRVDWAGLLHGLSLQLPAYLLVLREHGEQFRAALGEDRSRGKQSAGRRSGRADAWSVAGPVHPAGAFFQPVAVTPKKDLPPASEAPPPTPDELCQPYRRRGVFLEQAAEILDSNLAPETGSSFVHMTLTRNGQPHGGRTDSVSEEEFDAVMNWAESKMVHWGREILSGRAGVEPYRMGNASPCGRCEWRAVCRLDFDYNLPRYLSGGRRKESLAQMLSSARAV